MIAANRALSILYSYVKQLQAEGYTKVILPLNMCKEVLQGVQGLGMDVAVFDIDQEFHCNLDHIIASLDQHTMPILVYNHTYGNEFTDYEKLAELKTLFPKLKIIDDRCLCKPKLEAHQLDIVDMELYSTGDKKQVNLGLQGFGFCQDDFELFSIDLHKDEIIAIEESVIEIDNYKRQIQNELDHCIKAQKNFRDLYYQSIDDKSLFLDNEFNLWRCNILVENKGEVLDKIFESGHFASNHYQPLSKEGGPNALWLYDHVINLFIDKYANTEQVIAISQIINDLAIPVSQ